jgi:peptidoglycan-associated lipoprotein
LDFSTQSPAYYKKINCRVVENVFSILFLLTVLQYVEILGAEIKFTHYFKIYGGLVMWIRLVIMCCFCLLLTGVSSCPKKGANTTNKMDSVVKQIGDRRVFFDYEESSITEVSTDALLDVMEVLQDNPDAKVTLTGHTDNRGSHEYNLALGARRSDAAKKFMVICTPYIENRIKTASKGETELWLM